MTSALVSGKHARKTMLKVMHIMLMLALAICTLAKQVISSQPMTRKAPAVRMCAAPGKAAGPCQLLCHRVLAVLFRRRTNF